MKLVGAILKKVQSQDSIRYPSPPPEVDDLFKLYKTKTKKKKRTDKFADVRSKVDTRPPALDSHEQLRRLLGWTSRLAALQRENMRLVVAIKKIHLSRGVVDCSWAKLPAGNRQYGATRVDFLKRVERQNRAFYDVLQKTVPRVTPTAELEHNWRKVRRELLQRAGGTFLLFPPPPTRYKMFDPPEGFKRPRVSITLGFRRGAQLGALPVELFADACPRTCRLFADLLRGDGLGHSYVGTCFYRKVPGLYWSGGDVVGDRGSGCYAPRGRRAPPPAENYHFPHCVPGLLTMHVTKDDEVCGTFSITFKPLPHFDLRSVVFGRVVLPSRTFTSIQPLGRATSTQPVIEIVSAEFQ